MSVVKLRLIKKGEDSVMIRKATCKVEGCGNPVHAKGYCRKHYGQIWRKRQINVDRNDAAQKAGIRVTQRGDETDRMRALKQELRRAEMMYTNVIGLEGRLRWRREIAEVKQEMVRLGMPVPLSKAGQQTPRSVAVGF